ncbi:zonular occludens toxin domain-containing protein [Janthinobacterium sp. HLX7-2]|uniref:zonular occludens toxin domain-containing protein n=1 Tax=Janthinobacterium sp. HLX7-2 TaxID=1259331 RepID=UPI003F2126DD
MAMNNYTGLQGSGKSFEVVSSVILPAIAEGRRVVTNIAGINPDGIYDYLVEKKGVVRERLGTIVSFADDDILHPDFFPDESLPGVNSVVKGGDLVCVDEVWRVWAKDCKITPNHMQFFRMHRHYTDPVTGLSCDIAMMIQDHTLLHPKVRNTVEMTTVCTKLKAIGMPTKYRIEIYEGKSPSARCRLDRFNKSYNKDIFPLYKSYAAGVGKEKPMDQRQNILKNPKLWGMAVLTVIFLVAGPYFGYRALTGSLGGAAKDAKAVQSGHGDVKPLGGADVPAVAAKPSLPPFSESWRIVGKYTSRGEQWIVVTNPSGRVRVVSPSVFTNTGPAMIGVIDDQRVTSWTGAASTAATGSTEFKK